MKVKRRAGIPILLIALYYKGMTNLRNHLRVFLYAVIFGIIAYGFIQAGIVLHRYIIS